MRAAAEPLGEAPLLPSLGTGSAPAALHEGARAVGSVSSESPAPDSENETPGRLRAVPRGAWGLLPLRSWRLWLAVLLGALSVLAAAALRSEGRTPFRAAIGIAAVDVLLLVVTA